MFRYSSPLHPQVISQEGEGRDKVTAGVQFREGGGVARSSTTQRSSFSIFTPGGGDMKPLGVGV
jgi:hypothetical protein